MARRAKACCARCVVCPEISVGIAAIEAVALESLLFLMRIRPATEADRDAIWKIFNEVVAAGDTYALDPRMSREDALAYWFAPGTQTYVSEADGSINGTYILRPNQSGGGSHVANAAFMVPASARGEGIGR